jgi:hypothetical protein
MQNREELRQKGHDGSRKTKCRERGKKYHFQKGGGGGINIVFGPKYRPLKFTENTTNYAETYETSLVFKKFIIISQYLFLGHNKLEVRKTGIWNFF